MQHEEALQVLPSCTGWMLTDMEECGCAAGGNGPGTVPAAAAAAAVPGAVLLGALRRAAPSAPNRAVLLPLDLVPTLAAILSAAVASLNALTAALGGHHSFDRLCPRTLALEDSSIM